MMLHVLSLNGETIVSQPILGVDVGGTFTDFVYHDEHGLSITKVLSTRPDPSPALLAGIERLRVAQDAVIAHGTTVATNAVLEHMGARTALITTAGFRDVLAIGRQTRPALYRLSSPPRWLPAPDGLRFEVTERIAPTGEVVTPLAESEAAAVVDRAIAAGSEVLAVCLLFSFANPEHEQLIGRLARERGLKVSLSSAILPEFREFERTSTTVLNAYVTPLMGEYLDRLEAGLGQARRLWIMQSSGGILSAAQARQQAVRTLLSGPAGGAAGAFHVAGVAGYRDIITFDMGGTSTDVSLADGQLRNTSEGNVEGWPVRVPMLDIHTVGAGGGSLAWIDAGGALRAGPQSAGSNPGPACYGGGGQGFTVTDANLLLGRLHPANFLGGRMRLDVAAAERVAVPLAKGLGLSVIALAAGVLRVADARMEQAIRVVSVARGHDPRRFVLVAFGGAGPMHALTLAESLRIGRVLIPRYPGVLSALGLTLADFTLDFSRTVMWPEEMPAGTWQEAFATLEKQGRAELTQAGFSESDAILQRAADLRYRGQSFELTVPAEGDTAATLANFHKSHALRYGHSRASAPVEIVNLRVTARALRAKPVSPVAESVGDPNPQVARLGAIQLNTRDQWQSSPIYDRTRLLPGHVLSGPALVVQEDATTVILPGWRATVDAWLNLVAESV
jgi:N-methylhydantoinase A